MEGATNREAVWKPRPRRTALARLSLVAVLASAAALVLGASAASAIYDSACLADVYGAPSLSCTANDVHLATLQAVQGAVSCRPGEQITLDLQAEFSAGANRYDVGVFISTDGSAPNTMGGRCVWDFLHPIAASGVVDLGSGYGPFYNLEPDNTLDVCGDVVAGPSAFLNISSVSLVCADTDKDGVLDVPTCTTWGNAASSAASDACTSVFDAIPQSPSACSCSTVSVSNVLVPSTITVTKVLVPSTDPGRFDLQVNGATIVEDVGDGGTGGPVEVGLGGFVTVGETAHAGTDLADYDTSISCLRPGLAAPLPGGTILVGPGEGWTCTITNTKKTSPPSTGSLTISKTVDAGGAGFASGTFGVSAACSGDPGSPYQRTIDLPSPGNVTITGIPAGSVCTVTETSTPAAPAGYAWAAPAIDGPVTVTGGGTAAVTVANRLQPLPRPHIALTKSAAPQTYGTIGDVVGYELVATNDGDVTLDDVEIVDARLGSLSCTPAQPATLAAGASLTCTGTYTIQAGDLEAGGGGTVTNTATVTGVAPSGLEVSGTASVTVRQAASQVTATRATCRTFRDGSAEDEPQLAYRVKRGTVKSVTPNAIVVWSTVAAPAGGFTLSAVDANDGGWRSMGTKGMVLWDAACAKVRTATPSYDGSGDPVLTVSGATAGATYYVSTRYDASSLSGQPVAQPYPTVGYTFATLLNGSPAAGTVSVAVGFGG